LARRQFDGSEGVRLSTRVLDDLGRVPTLEVLLYESGVNFFYLQGDCEFWVGKMTGRYRHARLDDAQQHRLADDLFYGQCASRQLVGAWGPPPGLFDGSPTVIEDGTDHVPFENAAGLISR
jgi:hypothetical protein